MSFESTMYHEAGHAALRLLSEDIFGAPRLISALPEGDTAGYVMPSGDPVDYTPEAIRSYGRILAAGAVAETLAGFKSEGHQDDEEKLSKVALLARRGDGFTKECVDGAEWLLRLHWGGVKGIVEALRASSGELVAPHGIELARMALHRKPMQHLGLTLETLLRLAPSLERVPEIAGPLKAALGEPAQITAHLESVLIEGLEKMIAERPPISLYETPGI